MARIFDKPTNRERTVNYCMHALMVVACCLSMILWNALFPNDADAWKRGDEVVVQVENGRFLNVRAGAGTNNAVVGKVPNGAKGRIQNGPEFPAIGLTWYEVSWETPIQVRGWCAESYDGCVYLITPKRAMQKNKLVEKLFDLKEGTADAQTNHDYNGYRCNISWTVNGELVYDGGHPGWDVQTKDRSLNQNFYSLTDGELIWVGGSYNSIAIYNSDEDKTTLYAHANKILVSVEANKTIKVGDVLGTQGETGPNTTGVHVHIEVREGKTRFLAAGADGSQTGNHPTIDPIPYLYASIYKPVSPEPPVKPEPMTTDTIVRIEPDSMESPAVEQEIEFSLEIEDGENVAGYQATITFDSTALRYVNSTKGDYLPGDPFFRDTVEGNSITLIATSFDGESDGDGTLATLKFEVLLVKESTLTITDALLSDIDGKSSTPDVEHAEITKPTRRKEDINGDGTVNIQDLVLVASNFGETGENKADVNGDGVVNIQDLVLVAASFGAGDAAPSLYPKLREIFTAADVQHWLSQARQFALTDATSRRGILFLEQLLTALTPKQTLLLPNYPNPFNPETWIPYKLANPSHVRITIYDTHGSIVRQLDLGHQPVGLYQTRNRAAYWNGTNSFGELVASGLYFYTLTAGNFTATRRMLILK
ncbi:peptidoglycan DD-metalloendopeptidase family protein [Candidatus Poribacteria bacterium]|nr:peptidoglycan DD-metalloendopeptidase family protein [Candidatus Poribacteria bacterium]